MSARRLFWLGAAVLFSLAALVAIVAVLGSGLGQTQDNILATCAIAFVTGATVLAGFACLDRGVIRPVAWVAVALGPATFAAWTSAVWQDSPGTSYWKITGVLGIWTVALLIGTTLRLLASSQRLLVAVVPATWATAAFAAVVGPRWRYGTTEAPGSSWSCS